MASETVVPDHSTDEKVETKTNEEMKTIEQEGVSPSEESGGTEDGENSKSKDLASFETPVIDSEEKMGDKKIDLPEVVEVEKLKKVDGSPSSDVPVEDGPKVVEDLDSMLEVSAVSEPTIEAGRQTGPKEQSELPDVPVSSVESIEKPEEHSEVPPTQEPEISDSESKLIEKIESVVPDVPISSVEDIEKPEEHSEVPPIQEPKSEVGKESEEVSESESKIVEKTESAEEVVGKPQEQSEVIEGVEKTFEALEPKENVEAEIKKDEDTLPEKVEEIIKSLKEEQSGKDQEPVASQSLDTVASTDQEGKGDPKEIEGETLLPDVIEKAMEDIKKEEREVDGVEGLSKEAAVEVDKFKEEKEEKKVIVEEANEEKNVETEESIQPDTTKTEDLSGADSGKGVTEDSFEGEKASRDLEIVTEDKKEENGKDDIPTSVEATKDSDVEGKVNVINITSNEPVGVPNESELEVKAEETLQTGINNLEKAEEVAEEIAKSDSPILESSKDGEDPKTDGVLPKHEVPAKPIQKQSNGIISKVKQSIVKVKKAIIGKSPSSKTLSSEPKGDIKVK